LHDTPWRSLPLVTGLGLATIIQAPPFHDSTRVSLGPPCARSVPTARHDVGDTHDTDSRRLLWGGVPRLGLATIVQALPVHDSTSVFAPAYPTAMHARAEVHDTPRSPLPTVPLLGLATSFQAWPFHDSTSVRVPAFPTATHEFAETHDTALSMLLAVPLIGLLTSVQV
jgi:hypothetical protein